MGNSSSGTIAAVAEGNADEAFLELLKSDVIRLTALDKTQSLQALAEGIIEYLEKDKWIRNLDCKRGSRKGD